MQSLAKTRLHHVAKLDGPCSVESIEHNGITERITLRSEFDSVEEANVFLRRVAANLGHPLIPPLPDETVFHHRAVISTSAGLIGVDFDLVGGTASVTLTRGRRILLVSQGGRSNRTVVGNVTSTGLP